MTYVRDRQSLEPCDKLGCFDSRLCVRTVTKVADELWKHVTRTLIHDIEGLVEERGHSLAWGHGSLVECRLLGLSPIAFEEWRLEGQVGKDSFRCYLVEVHLCIMQTVLVPPKIRSFWPFKSVLTESRRGLLVVGRVTELVGLGEPPLGSWHSSSLSSHRTSMGWNKVLRHLFPVTGENLFPGLQPQLSLK